MSSKQLFLDETYTLDGVEVTGEQIKEALIDSFILRKGDGKWVTLQDLNHLLIFMMTYSYHVKPAEQKPTATS